MTSTVKFHSVPQNPENSHTVIINLSPSSSNRSWLTRRNIVIGGVLSIGITAAAVTAYLLSANNAFMETTLSTNTTETSTGFNGFADSTEPPINESLQSLHNIVRLVTTDSNGYDNCVPAFEAHWEHFKECGASVNKCMQNSIKLFGKLFCKPPTNSFGYIDDQSEQCEDNYFALARCDI